MKQLLCLIGVIFLSFGLVLPAGSQNELESTAEINIESGYGWNPTQNSESVTQIDYEEQNLHSGEPAAAPVQILFPHDGELYTAQNIPREVI